MDSNEANGGASGQQFGMQYRVKAIARFLDDAKNGIKASKSDWVALNRFNPNSEGVSDAQWGAVSRAADRAKLEWERWGDNPDPWLRWALIAHGISLTGHDGGEHSHFGRQLFKAGVSEARVTRLLDARGNAFTQTLPRLLRLLASKGVAVNWVELGTLVLNEGASDQKSQRIAESVRYRIAGYFFSTQADENRKSRAGNQPGENIEQD